MSVISQIKAVWRKMLGKDQISKLFDIEPVQRSEKMTTALQTYKEMRSGMPAWCTDGVDTIRFSNTICREIANLVMFNAELEVSGNEQLQTKVAEVMNILQEKQEECCATSGMMIKSNGTSLDFLTPEYFLITEHDNNGNALAAVFFSWIKKNDIYFVKAEYHRFEGDLYKISTKAYKTKDLDLIGDEVSLESVEQWKDIKPEVEISDLEYPLFVYWRTPYANAIDADSPLCVPIFAEAVTELRDLDIAYSRNATELKDSKRTILIDDRLTAQTGAKMGAGRSIDLPDNVTNVFGNDVKEFYQEINPTLNTDIRKVGINQQLSFIGYKCGFSNGYFTFDEHQGVQTATQVEADDRRTLQTVEAFRNVLDGKNHDGVLHRIVYLLYVNGVSNGDMPQSAYKVDCHFNDLTDNFEEDRARAWQQVINGMMPKWYYLAHFENYTEEEAKALIAEAQEASAAESSLFGEE